MRKWKWIHRWFSLVLGVFLLLWAFSGIILNHRELFSSIQISRSLLPAEYHFNNWNNASVRSALELENGKMFIYGAIGIWQTDTTFEEFFPYMNGLPEGVDQARTMKLVKATDGKIFAATQSGLYALDATSDRWTNIVLNIKDKRVVDLAIRKDTLFAMTRSEIFVYNIGETIDLIKTIQLSDASNDDGKIGLFRTLWVIHSGEIFGLPGKLIVDFMAFVLIFLIITGYIYFFFPRWIKNRRKQNLESKNHVKAIRFSVKWHNKVGVWTVFFLLITVFTGIFLRPPLLIAIASQRISKIPFTVLNHTNSWHDQLRALVWDESSKGWIIGTADGLFLVDASFSTVPVQIENTPPLSVMGINVLQAISEDDFLVGSFNGLFLWNPEKEVIIDYITGEIPVQKSSAGSPLGHYLIAGMINQGGKEYVFEYNKGLLHHEIPMPEVLQQTPMPLWNLALEVHTTRIFQSLIGVYYILIIPLFGLLTLLILLSGLVIWLKKYMSNRKKAI